MSTHDLTGRTALVTGGAQGLGESYARALAAAGARVAITDLQETGAQVAAELGGGHHFVQHDVTDEASWGNAITSTVDALGGLGVPLLADVECGHWAPYLPLVNGALAIVEHSAHKSAITQTLA